METEGEAGASGKVGVSEVGEGVRRPAGGKGHPGLCLQGGSKGVLGPSELLDRTSLFTSLPHLIWSPQPRCRPRCPRFKLRFRMVG